MTSASGTIGLVLVCTISKSIAWTARGCTPGTFSLKELITQESSVNRRHPEQQHIWPKRVIELKNEITPVHSPNRILLQLYFVRRRARHVPCEWNGKIE